MAAEDINIDLIIQTAESAKNLGELKKSMVDVRKALDSVEIGSKAFSKLNDTLDEGSERLKVFRKGFDGLKAFETFGRTISSSFGIASAAIAQFAEGNDELQKSLNRVGSALTLVQSFSSLAEAIKLAEEANLALNASLLTNPYVLVAAGIAAAVVALVGFNDDVDESVKKVDELTQSAKDLLQVFADERFSGGVKDLNDELSKLKDKNAGIAEYEALGRKIVELGKTGNLGFTFADPANEIKTLNEYRQTLEELTKDAADGGTRFQQFIRGNGLLQGQLEAEYKKTGDQVKAIEAVLKRNNAEKQVYLTLQEVERKRTQDIVDINKKNADELSKQKQIITDYLSGYTSLVNQSNLYTNALQLLGANQEDINQSNLQFLQQESDELNKQIPLIEAKIASNTKLKKDTTEYVAQLKNAKLALENIDLKVGLSGLKPDLFANIFGTNADNAQKLIEQQFESIIEPIRLKIAKFQIAVTKDLTKAENIPGEVGLSFVNGIVSPESQKAVGEYLDSYKQQLKDYSDLLNEFKQDQDIFSAVIETSQNNIANFFTFFNQKQSSSESFTEKFKTIVDDIERIVGLSGERLSGIIEQSQTLTNKDLGQIVKVVKSFYDDYNKTLINTKTNLDKLYKDGRITFEEYQAALRESSISSVKPLEDFENRLESIIALISDPKAKQAAKDLFQSLANGASGTIGQLNEVVKVQDSYLTEAQEKQRQEFDKNASAFESRVGQLNSILQQASDQRLQILSDERDKSLAILTDQFDRGLISQQQYKEKSTLLDKEYQLKEKAERKRAFEATKAASIIQAVINTALAVSSAIAIGPPAGYILAAVSAALGAAQIGIIASQPTPEFADGGFVIGPGGNRDDSIDARLSNGEYVMNAKSTSAFRPLLDQLNYGFAGLSSKIEDGKPNAVTSTQNSAKSVDGGQTIRVVVLQSDLEMSQKKSDDIKARVTF